MNIGIVTTWFERGAAYVSRQYRQSLEPHHDVFIYARGGEAYAIGDPVWDDERVTWGKKTKFGMWTAIDLKDFRGWLERERITLVLFNEQWWWPPVLLCNELGIKTGAYIDYYTEETVPFFNCYDFLICNTRRHYSAFDWHPQCLYLPWGTDLNLFKPKTLSPVNRGCVTFFHSGGMSPERKGTDLVIEAFAGLTRDAKLVVHSQQALKTYFPRLADLIQELETDDRLILHEKTVPAPGLYYLGDVYVYPTRLEGIGLTIMEAMACGLPVIVPDNPPMSEFVEDNTNSRLVSVDRLVSRADGYYWPQCFANLDSLRLQMEFYIHKRQHLTEFKSEARQYAEQKFDWLQNAASLPEYFEKVTKMSAKESDFARERVLEFERRRTTLAQRYPVAFQMKDIAGQSIRFMKRQVAQFKATKQ